MNIDYLYKNGVEKALAMSYDDGSHWDRRLVEIFNKYGIKGTFHINAGRMTEEEGHITPEEAKKLYAGHEIAGHSLNHTYFDKMSTVILQHEIAEDKRLLEKITGEPVRGFSYPNGVTNDATHATLSLYGIQYARLAREHGGFSLPEDFLMWQPTMHHGPSMFDKMDLFKSFSRPIQYSLPLFLMWGHSWEFQRPTTNTSWEMMEEFCDKFTATFEDRVWYATCIEICDYVTALRRLLFSVDLETVYNPSGETVWLSVDGEAVRIPYGTTRLK